MAGNAYPHILFAKDAETLPKERLAQIVVHELGGTSTPGSINVVVDVDGYAVTFWYDDDADGLAERYADFLPESARRRRLAACTTMIDASGDLDPTRAHVAALDRVWAALAQVEGVWVFSEEAKRFVGLDYGDGLPGLDAERPVPVDNEPEPDLVEITGPPTPSPAPVWEPTTRPAPVEPTPPAPEREPAPAPVETPEPAPVETPAAPVEAPAPAPVETPAAPIETPAPAPVETPAAPIQTPAVPTQDRPLAPAASTTGDTTGETTTTADGTTIVPPRPEPVVRDADAPEATPRPTDAEPAETSEPTETPQTSSEDEPTQGGFFRRLFGRRK